MSVPEFIPQVRDTLIVRLKPAHLRGRDIGGYRKDFVIQSSSNMKEINFKEISKGIESGLIKWDQLSFNKECLNYIQRNIHLLDK